MNFDLPGFVNGHVHLELSHLAGRVPGGGGLPAWVRGLFRQPEQPSADIERALARTLGQLGDNGTWGVVDVANTGRSTRALVDTDTHAVVQRELVGWNPKRWSLALATIEADGQGPPGQEQVRAVPTAHSTYSCSPELIATALHTDDPSAHGPRPDGSPGLPLKTIHCSEDASELEFLRKAKGPWADLLNFLGRPWQERHLRARSPVGLLHQLGVLGPHVALVHCVHVDEEDLDIIAESGATVVLCPRSNLHIGGRLPPALAMARRGIPLAIGTDSLASTPDLDLLAEAAVLRGAFPGMDPQIWLDALTIGGARLLGLERADASVRFSLPEERVRREGPVATLLDGTSWSREWIS